MEMRDQDKGIEMPNTLGYNLQNRDSPSSSPTLASALGERSDQPPQTQTLIFSDPPQTSHHHHLYPPPPPLLPPNQLQQPHRPRRDPDPSSSPIATTSITSSPVVSGSNPPRTPQPPPTTQTTGTTISTPLIRYRECLKNHAAGTGGHVIDGCGEFMPSGEEGTPESLRCAACECHRNFHRKDAEGQPQHVLSYYSCYPNKSNGHNRIPSPHRPTHLQFPTPSSSLHQHHRFAHGVATPSPGLIPPVMMAFGGGAGGPAESSSEDLNMFQSYAGGQLSVQPLQSKKRFRTKFTQQQKDSMMEFADKLGWKIQKHDEPEVNQFCSQLGVKRQVFKVWMHNNKQAMKKQQM